MEGLLVVNGLTYEMVTEPEPTVKASIATPDPILVMKSSDVPAVPP